VTGLPSYALTRKAHTHPFNGPFSGTTRVSRYQKGKTNLDFTEARDSDWQWHQLSWAICKSAPRSRQPHQHPTTLFLQPGCPSCRPTKSVKALTCKAHFRKIFNTESQETVDVCLEMFGCLQAERTIAIRTSKCSNKFSVRPIHNALCRVFAAKTELESCGTDV